MESKMANYKIQVAYDGARYKGWQRLGDSDMTVQGKIEDVLTKLTIENVEVNGSGRTDAGVHAEYQIANFQLQDELPASEIKEYLYRYLPDDIVVKKVQKVEDRFHARFNSVSKTYTYRIWNHHQHDPFNRKHMLHVQEGLNLEVMEKASEYFVGKYDFSAFTTAKSKKKSMVREIKSIQIQKDGNCISIAIEADGFLHKMVRKIVGTLLEVGLGRMKLNTVPELIGQKDRSKSAPVAPAHGLFLTYVKY